jgi:hypothetical protein
MTGLSWEAAASLVGSAAAHGRDDSVVMFLLGAERAT